MAGALAGAAAGAQAARNLGGAQPRLLHSLDLQKQGWTVEGGKVEDREEEAAEWHEEAGQR